MVRQNANRIHRISRSIVPGLEPMVVNEVLHVVCHPCSFPCPKIQWRPNNTSSTNVNNITIKLRETKLHYPGEQNVIIVILTPGVSSSSVIFTENSSDSPVNGMGSTVLPAALSFSRRLSLRICTNKLLTVLTINMS